MIVESTYDHLPRNDTNKMERLSKNEEQRMGESILKKSKERKTKLVIGWIYPRNYRTYRNGNLAKFFSYFCNAKKISCSILLRMEQLLELVWCLQL